MRDTVEAASVVCSVVKTKMSSLCRRQRDSRCLRITHLADHDHIRRLPHRRPKSGREVRRIDPDLHLLDQAAIMRVFVLNRIFNRHDVARIFLIDRVYQRGESRRFPRSSRSANDYQPALQCSQSRDPGGSLSSSSAGTFEGSERTVAAARPRSRCRLMRNRPSPSMR